MTLVRIAQTERVGVEYLLHAEAPEPAHRADAHLRADQPRRDDAETAIRRGEYIANAGRVRFLDRHQSVDEYVRHVARIDVVRRFAFPIAHVCPFSLDAMHTLHHAKVVKLTNRGMKLRRGNTGAGIFQNNPNYVALI